MSERGADWVKVAASFKAAITIGHRHYYTSFCSRWIARKKERKKRQSERFDMEDKAAEFPKQQQRRQQHLPLCLSRVPGGGSWSCFSSCCWVGAASMIALKENKQLVTVNVSKTWDKTLLFNLSELTRTLGFFPPSKSMLIVNGCRESQLYSCQMREEFTQQLVPWKPTYYKPIRLNESLRNNI